MAAFETNSESSLERITLPEPPFFHCRCSKKLLLLVMALLFFGGSFVVPQLQNAGNTKHQLDISHYVSKLKEAIEVLKEESMLTGNEAAKWDQYLSELMKNAVGENPLESWEALDHLEKSLQEKAAAVEQSSLELDKLDSLEKIAGTLDD